MIARAPGAGGSAAGQPPGACVGPPWTGLQAAGQPLTSGLSAGSSLAAFERWVAREALPPRVLASSPSHRSRWGALRGAHLAAATTAAAAAPLGEPRVSEQRLQAPTDTSKCPPRSGAGPARAARRGRRAEPPDHQQGLSPSPAPATSRQGRGTPASKHHHGRGAEGSSEGLPSGWGGWRLIPGSLIEAL